MLKNQKPSKGELSTSWWRSMRVLFQEGRPLQPHVRLVALPTTNESALFGVLGKTQVQSSDRHRLIYWLPLPKGLPEPTPEHPHIIIDHITLELWSGKSHPTWYCHDGQSASPNESRGWKLQPVEGQGFSHWFTMMIQHSVLDEQDVEVEVNVTSPTVKESERRVQEFVKHAQESQLGRVDLPPMPHAGNYICCSFFVRTDDRAVDYNGLVRCMAQIPWWENVTVDDSCKEAPLTRGSTINVGGTEVVTVTACPGGTIKSKCAFAISTTPRK